MSDRLACRLAATRLLVTRSLATRFLASVVAIAAGLSVVAQRDDARADAKPDSAKMTVGPIAVTASPITSFVRTGGTQTRFGRLDFRGGLVLSSPDAPTFGGWSGLVLEPDGRRFLAVSDAGTWLTGAFAYSDDTLTGVTDARTGPLLANDGRPLKRPRDCDAEAVALASGDVKAGSVQISFEQNARIARYDVTAAGLSASRSFLEKPAAARAMRRNGGFEAMTVMAGGPFAGATVAIAERFYDSKRNHRGWIWTKGGIQPFTLTNIGDFDITDVASLPDGTLFVLERRFRWLEGVKMRIRRISPDQFAPGRTIAGDTLIEATLENEIDNMEGLAVTRQPGGGVRLTLISDDNFNPYLQRTVVLQFDLSDAQTVKAKE